MLKRLLFLPCIFMLATAVLAQVDIELLRSAEQGDPADQFELSMHYYFGTGGFDEDHAEVARWLALAATQGYAPAQHQLGIMYYTGALGAAAAGDWVEGVRWFTLAAEQGYADAQFSLALAYGSGLGVNWDEVESVRWFRLAAEQGHPKAQYSLGLAHQYGYGATRDLTEAIRWYEMAAEQGHAAAQGRLQKLSAD